MLEVLKAIEAEQAGLDKEMEEIVKFTLELDEPDRIGYLHFSLRQKHVQLRLRRRIAHRQEQFELCAAINRIIKRLEPFLNEIPA